MSSKYINSRMTYQEDGIDYQDNDFIALLQKHLQDALLEIEALKAQVNRLRDVLLEERKRYHVAKDLDEALEATPEQCLAEVKAKAIEDVANALLTDEDYHKSDEWYVDFIMRHANKIRE